MLSVRHLLAIANAALLALAGARELRPNVVVLAGDFRAGDGSRVMELLAKGGTTFETCYVSSQPVKTLASLLTGCHELRAGVVSDHGGRNFIRPEVPLISDAFKAAGYQTALFGAWGLGDALPFRPEDRGFVDILIDSGGKPGDPWGSDSGSPWLRDTKGWARHEESSRNVLATGVGKWLKEHSGQSCFLQVNFPVGAEDAATEILSSLDQLDLAGNTIIVALNLAGKVVPGTTEVDAPWVIRWPGHVPAGRASKTPVAAYDLMPTLATLSGVSLFRDWKGDGTDLSKLLTQSPEELSQRTFFFHPGSWPADQAVDRYKSDGFSVRKGDWRLAGLELQDISLPAEKRVNEFENQSDRALGMMADYGLWWQSLRPSLSGPARIIVGDARQPLVPLTWGDWWPSRETTTALGPDQYLDQAALRGLLAALAEPEKAAKLPSISGVWKLHANQQGHYKVTLSKLPPEADAVAREQFGKLKEGVAHARSGKYEVKTPLLEGATSLSLGVDLNEGDSDLEAWFEGQGGKDTILGAFFATIERVGERKMPDPDWKAQLKDGAK